MSGGAGFTIPGGSGPVDPLPPEVVRQIEESVKRFEDRWNRFGMLMLARTNGWISDYKAELIALAATAFRFGKAAK
jgi:hypothetical protein